MGEGCVVEAMSPMGLRSVRTRAVLLTILAAALLLSSGSLTSAAPSSWTTGQEKELTGHTFTETSWAAEVLYGNGTGGNSTTFGVSYHNKYSTQAFLVNLKIHTNANGRESTVPYQMFGLHYNTLLGQEVFIGSILSFLMAFVLVLRPTGLTGGRELTLDRLTRRRVGA